MPTMRPLKRNETDLMRVFLSDEQVDNIVASMVAGKKVMLESSTITDLGNDFVTIHVDGQPVASIFGY